jgi:hypothetical protein
MAYIYKLCAIGAKKDEKIKKSGKRLEKINFCNRIKKTLLFWR